MGALVSLLCLCPSVDRLVEPAGFDPERSGGGTPPQHLGEGGEHESARGGIARIPQGTPPQRERRSPLSIGFGQQGGPCIGGLCSRQGEQGPGSGPQTCMRLEGRGLEHEARRLVAAGEGHLFGEGGETPRESATRVPTPELAEIGESALEAQERQASFQRGRAIGQPPQQPLSGRLFDGHERLRELQGGASRFSLHRFGIVFRAARKEEQARAQVGIGHGAGRAPQETIHGGVAANLSDQIANHGARAVVLASQGAPGGRKKSQHHGTLTVSGARRHHELVGEALRHVAIRCHEKGERLRIGGTRAERSLDRVEGARRQRDARPDARLLLGVGGRLERPRAKTARDEEIGGGTQEAQPRRAHTDGFRALGGAREDLQRLERAGGMFPCPPFGRALAEPRRDGAAAPSLGGRFEPRGGLLVASRGGVLLREPPEARVPLVVVDERTQRRRELLGTTCFV